MSEKEAVLQRAREWLTEQDFGKCPNENCTAVNRWKLGEVSVVNQFQINKEKRRGEEVKDVPVQYAVPVICASRGRDYYHYEEPERT